MDKFFLIHGCNLTMIYTFLIMQLSVKILMTKWRDARSCCCSCVRFHTTNVKILIVKQSKWNEFPFSEWHTCSYSDRFISKPVPVFMTYSICYHWLVSDNSTFFRSGLESESIMAELHFKFLLILLYLLNNCLVSRCIHTLLLYFFNILNSNLNRRTPFSFFPIPKL